ncbi:MAG: von Willebrand factor type A domain-containing protein, partial [bacterium]
MNPCNNKSRLTAYLLGELPKPEAEALDAHLAACPECRAAATDLRATLALLQDALAPAAGAEPALVLDSTRRQRLLAVRPERVPTRFSCWFFRRHPALRSAAAAVVVISIVMFGIVNTGRFAGCSQSAPFLSDYKCIASLGSSESSLSDVSGRDQSGLLSGDVCVGRKVAEIPLLTPPPPARVRPEEPQPSPELAAPAGDWAYVNGKAKELQRGYFGYARTARAGGAAQAKHDEDSAKPGAFKPGDTGRGEGEPVKQDIDADGWADAKDAVRKTAPEGKTRLNIALPKPVFSGTPKDINGDYQRMVERELKEESQSKAALGLRTDKAGQVPATETPPASGPAVFDSPAIVKSPVKMKGLYAKRAPAASTPPTQPIGGGGEGGKALDVTVTWEEDSDQLKIDTAGEKRLDNVVSDQRGDKLTKSETKPTDGRDSRLKAGNESAVNTEVGGISGLDKSGADTLTLNGANTFAGGVTVVSGTLREVKKEAADEKEGFEKTAEKPAPAAFNPFVAAAGQPFSTFAMDVDTASYTLTRQAVRSGAMPEPERVRTEEIVNAF